jgi:hypothetical protein
MPTLVELWMTLERRLFQPDSEYVSLLREERCRLAVITNPLQDLEMPLYTAAASLGLPSLGLARSWDNLYKPLRIRTDVIAVWNNVNRDEAVRLLKYRLRRVAVTGATQFDPYFAPDAVWSRERFAATMQLDPTRPIVTLATAGVSIVQPYDETHLVDFLLKAIADYRIAGRPQLVVRLHPASRFENFGKYARLPDLRISHVEGNIPALDWTMTRNEVVEVGNLLRHSNAVVSPGSTITIEAALFDTPLIVPTFHLYQPESATLQWNHLFSRHYRRLRDMDLVPFVNDPEALVQAVNRSLADRTWYREQRAQLVTDYIQFTDGRSTERVADLIACLINSSTAG